MRLGLKTAPQIRTTTPRRRVKILLTDIGASFERRCCSVAVNWDVLLNLLVSGKAPAKSNYYFCRSALKVDVPGELIADFELVFVQEA